MKKVHFIAMGGSVMHNLAIALHDAGMQVTGSDDEFFEPSKSRLAARGLLPAYDGWNPDAITPDLDAVILGMHARVDNPELIRAKELNVRIYSYPEYLYEHTRNKIRVVVGGSHGKTTTTSMIMHVLREAGVKFDYMVGAQLEGFETMVRLSRDAKIAVFEGDEYLTSPLDLTPKFHWYRPTIALLTGIAWDHINVFPTWENYVWQFEEFSRRIEPNGTLVYYVGDPELKKIASGCRADIKTLPYDGLKAANDHGATVAEHAGKRYELSVFGSHNMQNIHGAMLVCRELGVDDDAFMTAMKTFRGAAKRLQILKQTSDSTIFLDFAHSPSKLKATTEAVREHFPDRKLVAVMELHTFSSLNKSFLPQYAHAMDAADEAYVYYNPEVIEHKRLEPIEPKDVERNFAHRNMSVFMDSALLVSHLRQLDLKNTTLLIMTSGNFSGVDLKQLADQLIG